MTEHQRRHHEALERAGGNVAQAAQELGITPNSLYTVINQNKPLRDLWGKRSLKPTTSKDAREIHRNLPAPLSSMPLDVADAIEAEDRAVRAGLDAMGVTGKAADQAVALQKFANKHFTKAIEMIGGGVVKLFLNMLAEIDKLSNEISNIDHSGTPEQAVAAAAREHALRTDRSTLIAEASKIYDRAHKAQHLQAVIKHMEKEKKQAQKPKGFLALQAQPGSTVNVTMQGDETDDDND